MIVALGSGLTVTATFGDFRTHPFAFVTVTLYEPPLATLIDCVVAPFDQRYVRPPGALRVTLPPSQNVVGPLGVTVASGSGFVVTVIGAEVFEQFDAFVTVTV